MESCNSPIVLFEWLTFKLMRREERTEHVSARTHARMHLGSSFFSKYILLKLVEVIDADEIKLFTGQVGLVAKKMVTHDCKKKYLVL